MTRTESISLAEFSGQNSPFLRDPIEAFQLGDANSDRHRLTELLAIDAGREAAFGAANLAAFDENNDQRLSLTEYRVSMLGNFNYPWHVIPVDQNLDRRLSFNEFRFDDRSLFHLQRRFYFHRLDIDRDGELSLDEFTFETSKSQSLVRLATNGSERKQVFRADDFPDCGSPDVSPDGRFLLFDAKGTRRRTNQ